MEKFEENAYTQAYVIINFLVDIGEIVISNNILENIEKNMNRDYYFNLNDINKTTLLPDTEKILSFIFEDCVVTDKERDIIEKASKEIKRVIEKEENQESLLLDLNSLKWSEKFKMKIKKLLKLYKINTENNKVYNS